jgi:hypothetical protein
MPAARQAAPPPAVVLSEKSPPAALVNGSAVSVTEPSSHTSVVEGEQFQIAQFRVKALCGLEDDALVMPPWAPEQLLTMVFSTIVSGPHCIPEPVELKTTQLRIQQPRELADTAIEAEDAVRAGHVHAHGAGLGVGLELDIIRPDQVGTGRDKRG